MILALILTTLTTAFAQIDQENIHAALGTKRGLYYSKGLVSGGDRGSSDYIIKDIRIAKNPAGYDRIVFELSGNKLGSPSVLARAPFFTVTLEPSSQKITVSIFGQPKPQFSLSQIQNQMKRTAHLKELKIVPPVNDARWVGEFSTHGAVRAEVLEFSGPARIVIDLMK